MTDESNLEDGLFEDAFPEEVDETIHSTNEPQDEEFLRSVLGPHAAEALKDPNLKAPQEAYNPKKPVEPKAYITDGGKEIRLEQKQSGKFIIKFYPGGELPKQLQGEYTDETVARQAIRVYLGQRAA